MKKALEDSDFKFIMGSKIWPSDDPEDSPIDIFRCIYCGHEIRFMGCGSFFEGEQEKEAKSVVLQKVNHRIVCSAWPIETSKQILQTTGELKAILEDYPDIKISVHGSNYFRIKYEPTIPMISIVGVGSK